CARASCATGRAMGSGVPGWTRGGGGCSVVASVSDTPGTGVGGCAGWRVGGPATGLGGWLRAATGVGTCVPGGGGQEPGGVDGGGQDWGAREGGAEAAGLKA